MGAEASFAFVGNTDHNVPFMLKNSDLFEALPPQFHDSAFIDRLHAYLPGWEVDVIRGEMFTKGYGFIVDYLAEILRHLRAEDFSHRPDQYFSISEKISTRDRDAVYKTMSGLLKLIFPNGGEAEDEMEELLRLAMESRKRVKDQLARIDSTYPDVDFHYTGPDGQKRKVTTVEEEEFPQFYNLKPALNPDGQETVGQDDVINEKPAPNAEAAVTDGELSANSNPTKYPPKEGHFVFSENRKGISYAQLFGPYLDGAKKITITDPYIWLFYQVRNVMELIEMLIQRKAPEDQMSVHLVTGPDEGNITKQRENLDAIVAASSGTGVNFTWAFDQSGTAHARHIVTDTGWKISLDRGLDIFQQYAMNDSFNPANRLQEQRSIKQFEVTFLRIEDAAAT